MEDEERALSVVANLFQGLSRGSRRDRLAAKFVENEFEKCDRLVEFFDRYQRRVQIAEVILIIHLRFITRFIYNLGRGLRILREHL